MNKVIFFLLLLCLLTKTQIIFAQTHYTGIATVTHLLDDCTGQHIDSAIHDISYSVIPRKGNTDSISFTISISIAYNSAIIVTKRVYPFDGFAGIPITDTIVYLKKDADSIIFSFRLHYNFTEHNPSVPITDPCRNHDDDEYFYGIARISTLTAGIKENVNPETPLKLFPNPTNGLLRINSIAEKVTVIDNLGRIYTTQPLDAIDIQGFRTLDVSSLPSGYYTLLLNEGMKKSTGQFIKY